MWSATPTKATRVRIWTAAFWKVIPHSVLEAMAIAGYTAGADRGFIYIRAEYPLAIRRLQKAIEDATEMGLLGDGILGTDFSFNIEIAPRRRRLRLRRGNGADRLDRRRARHATATRPPFPAVKGLWDQPTVINNVETWANIPVIIPAAARGLPKSERRQQGNQGVSP